jgi:hypothetical protein
VTSGHIVSQNRKFVDLELPHYDIIIYDQLNSPTLWVEENSDYSEEGKTRAIPAEYVRAVLEIKSNLTEESSKEAVDKLFELRPLLRTEEDKDVYNGKLHPHFFTASVFFELQKANEFKKQILNNLVVTLDFPFFGALILKAEGRDINDTGLLRILVGETPIESTVDKTKESLIFGLTTSDSILAQDGKHVLTMLSWMPPNFSFFAFDIIALLEGRFRPGFSSSNYGLSWMNPNRKK